MFRIFRDCTKQGLFEKSRFELHQATERFYACSLLVYTNYRPKTHNLKQLLGLCVQQEPRFLPLFPQDTKFHHSEHYKITQEELTWLGEQVKQLQTLTNEVCLEKIARFLD
ncbi:MAG: hypothetical protein P8163_19695 [Candidatus Thiodiazotropha sp.]